MASARLSDYGFKITLTIKDPAGVVVDVSGATTRQILLTDPSGNEDAKVASFTTNGTDGKIETTVAASVLDQAGRWSIRGRVFDGSTFQYTSTRVYLGTS